MVVLFTSFSDLLFILTITYLCDNICHKLWKFQWEIRNNNTCYLIQKANCVHLYWGEFDELVSELASLKSTIINLSKYKCTRIDYMCYQRHDKASEKKMKVKMTVNTTKSFVSYELGTKFSLFSAFSHAWLNFCSDQLNPNCGDHDKIITMQNYVGKIPFFELMVSHGLRWSTSNIFFLVVSSAKI